MTQKRFKLTETPIHLGLGATATVEPHFTGDMAWYEAYVSRHEADGAEGRLVSMFTFEEPWTMWEMHPRGSEVVVCVSGRLTLIQDVDGVETRSELGPGDAVINQPGVWHTADANQPATVLFITAGLGTEHRPR